MDAEQPGPAAALKPADVARALQDTLALLSPNWGTHAPTWDELGADIAGGGPWVQHLVASVVEELIRSGVIAPVSRDDLAHLSRDWDAQAAGIERAKMSDGRKAAASTLRWCAAQLRARIGAKQDGAG